MGDEETKPKSLTEEILDKMGSLVTTAFGLSQLLHGLMRLNPYSKRFLEHKTL